MSTTTGTNVVRSRRAKVVEAIRLATETRVLVGVPNTTAGRDGPINNAALAYIHDNGAPEVNVPARPFMAPGIESVAAEINERQINIGKAAFAGRREAVLQGQNALGLVVSSAIKRRIDQGIPPPLADSTIRNRRYARGTSSIRKGEVEELANRAAGRAPSTSLVKPLVNTGQFRNAITYVVRKV